MTRQKILMTLSALFLGMSTCQASDFFSEEKEQGLDGFTTTKKVIAPFVGKETRVNYQSFKCTIPDEGEQYFNKLTEDHRINFYRFLGESFEFYANVIIGGKTHEILRLIPLKNPIAK